MAELADALDLGSSTERCMGSSPTSDTIKGGVYSEKYILII